MAASLISLDYDNAARERILRILALHERLEPDVQRAVAEWRIDLGPPATWSPVGSPPGRFGRRLRRVRRIAGYGGFASRLVHGVY